jgi:putative spermidine/putrescine transport system permease protein
MRLILLVAGSRGRLASLLERSWLLALLPVVVVLAAVLVPLTVWTIRAVSHFGSGIDDTVLSHSLLRTHELAVLVGIAANMLAAPVALLSEVRGKVFRAVIFLPSFLGLLARNHAWVGMLSQEGVGASLGWTWIGGRALVHTEAAVAIVMTFIFLPWAYFVQRVGLNAIKPEQVEAATVLGAAPAALIRKLFAPFLARSLVVSFALIYGCSLGFFITPKMVGPNRGDLVSGLIVRFVALGDFAAASSIGLLLLLSCLPGVFLFIWLAHRRRGLISWDT